MSGRVVAAMSGGVDSSVAAALLHESGYDVVGVAMRLAPEPAPSGGARRRGTCCSHDDFEDARRVAERLGFPFYVIDLREDFAARVVDHFVGEYVAGRTPNPCVMCNQEIKFDRLWHRARALDADYVATGHYARIEPNASGHPRLLRAVDASKDQSYFLFGLSEDALSRTLFPLGRLTKAQVRARARELGLRNADKPESQEICFVPDGDYARFVERRADPTRLRPGRIVDASGRSLGAHDGVHRFTIGQRRGIGVAGGEPFYVRELRADAAEVVVGRAAELGSSGLSAVRVNLIDPALAARPGAAVEVKIRYRHPAIAARLTMVGGDRAEVLFAGRGPAVSPGQACVFYRGEEVVGGGFIERAI
jgi:tRNA-specific 2-thiouridylase